MSDERKPVPGVRAGFLSEDRRAAPRFATALEASCTALMERRSSVIVRVRVRDVSANGIGLLSARRFERGTTLVVQVLEESRPRAPRLMGKVVHVTVRGDGEWLIGCKLTRELSAEEVQALAGGDPS